MIPLTHPNKIQNSVTKAVFNYTDWKVLWTVLFVYAIQTSVFAVFFGQLFKRRNILFLPIIKSENEDNFTHILALLAKLVGLVIWIITFVDFYPSAPVGIRYFLCFFPNAGLLFCIQVMQQYERRSSKSSR